MTERRRRRRPASPGGRSARPRARGAGGFTLVELLVVMVIISILLGFILRAAMDSVKRAQERATQSLITKLEQGLNDRLEALLQTRPDPNSAHAYIATIINSNSPNTFMTSNGRAQAIAWYDYVKRYMPDTFYVANAAPTASVGVYPINFAANPYPISGASATDQAGLGLYILPMGNSVGTPYGDASGTSTYTMTGNSPVMAYNPTGDGIFGAAYPVAAGIYKNLGYLPAGYDGIDNNGDGAVDDALEGLSGAPSVPSPDNPNTTITALELVQARLSNHRHVTARAEMLYALLVEGQGPLGSVFDADDFTDQEVKDTDNDGLPEFVDAWGNPLQFFRWPLLYHSDLQLGQAMVPGGAGAWALSPPYLSMFQQREQDPLDLNQQLVAPAWWSNTYNNSILTQYDNLPDYKLGASGGALAFSYYFHRLTEPYPNPDPTNTYTSANYWDRGSTYGTRRAFYYKPLILSAGLDGQYGVFLYSDTGTLALSGTSNPAWALIANENNAMPFSTADFIDFTSASAYSSATITYSDSVDPTAPSTGDLIQAAQDDITNQNIQTTIGIGGAQ